MIIFLYGEDTYRSRQKFKQIRDKFFEEIDKNSSSFDILDGEKIGLGKINETAAAAPLFAKRRMVLVENIFKNKDKSIFQDLSDYLEKKKRSAGDQDTIMVFWDESSSEKLKANVLFKFLIKEKIVQEFKPLNNTETIDWIKEEVKQRNASIKGQAAVLLASILGGNLWQLSNEINKLINFKRGEQPGLIGRDQAVHIDNTDVENLVRGRADENIFALTDAISAKDKSKAFELLENELRSGVTESYLLAMIIRQFKILIQVKTALIAGLSGRKIQNELKLHPYVVQKASMQAKNFSLELLKHLYRETVETDYAVKTGRANVKTALSLMFSRI